jgi:plastocyanin
MKGTGETLNSTGRARKGVLVTAMAAAIAAVAMALLPMLASSSASNVRTIDIVVRDMAFYVGDDRTPNPEIVLNAGERIRFRVRNEDAGMRHDFTIKAWTVATKMLEDRGEEDAIEFRVPDTPGTGTYTCTPHPRMMTGTIRVE